MYDWRSYCKTGQDVLVFLSGSAKIEQTAILSPRGLQWNTLVRVENYDLPRRTATSIGESAAEAEKARLAGMSVAYQSRLQQASCVKGYSLFLESIPAMRTSYPHLKHLWSMGPSVVPCDSMHLILLNVVPHMWKFFAVLKLVNNDKEEVYVILKATVALIGRALRAARWTVPTAQAQSLRNNDTHHMSLKAADWMHFVLAAPKYSQPDGFLRLTTPCLCH